MKRIVLLVLIVVIFICASILLLQNHSGEKLSPVSSPKETSVPSSSTGSLQAVPFSLTLPKGYKIGIFASNLGDPRDLELTPGGWILVSSPNTNTVYALKNNHNSGVADVSVALKGENVVHGLAFHLGKLYVAEKNSVNRYSFDETSGKATFEKKLLDLPGESNHIYRTLVFGSDNKLYVSIGSNCNVCVESNPEVGTVIVANEDGSDPRVFAKGQRNAPFLVLNPITHEIWATGMGRDYLGDNIPPDEINILRDGGDYGWPICYGDKVHDTQFDTKKYIQDPCSKTVPPIYEIPAHSAPLGLAFVPAAFNPSWKGDLLVAYHGSWNRSVKTGYKVVHMKVAGNTITSVDDFITGFLEDNNVLARPVDLLFDTKGNLYISDDKSGYIFIVRKKS